MPNTSTYGQATLTSPSSSKDSVKKRTSHACDRCRLLRTKCSGGGRCVRCTKDDAVCIYGDHKRERNKKDLVESSRRIKDLEADNRTLVSTLRSLSSAPGFLIQDYPDLPEFLARYPEDNQADSSPEPRSRTQSIASSITTTDVRREKRGERHAPSSIGSPGNQGELRRPVDLDRGTGAAGYVGKMSEMSWMQRCREHLDDQAISHLSNADSEEGDELRVATVDLTYFVDDVNLLSIDEDHIDPFQWPPFEAAIIAAEAFFHATEGTFDFIMREQFMHTMYGFAQQSIMRTWEYRRWLAVANLVWAIGSKWLYLTKFADTLSLESHLLFYARARALGLDHRISFDHPDIDMVQGIGITALYLVVNGSISRAWNAVGNAVRHAMTLGLHLKVSDVSLGSTELIKRARTWFSLYKLQMLISEITGRPQLIRTAHVTIPMEVLEQPSFDIIMTDPNSTHLEPSQQSKRIWFKYLQSKTAVSPDILINDVVVAQESNPEDSTSQELFLYHLRLSQLCEEIADQLFTGRQEIPWSQTQQKIGDLQNALDAFNGTLPDNLKLPPGTQHDKNYKYRIQLATYTHSLSMMLHRPCLCEINIENESDSSKTFNLTSARACIQAALSMIDILPDAASAEQLHQSLPWWALPHYLCQAGAVLLLELCLDSQHIQGETARILGPLNKAMSCLAYLAEESLSAYKAWRVFDNLLRRVSARYPDPQIFKVHQQALRPQRWTEVEENALQLALL